MSTPQQRRSASAERGIFREFSEFYASVTPGDIAVAWGVVLAAAGAILLASGLG